MDVIGYLDLFSWGFGVKVQRMRSIAISRDTGDYVPGPMGVSLQFQVLCLIIGIVVRD